MLKSTGIEPERLQMSYCSAAEGQKFQSDAIAFDKKIQELGPNPFKKEGDKGSKKAKA